MFTLSSLLGQSRPPNKLKRVQSIYPFRHTLHVASLFLRRLCSLHIEFIYDNLEMPVMLSFGTNKG